jgi:hypothetical protein
MLNAFLHRKAGPQTNHNFEHIRRYEPLIQVQRKTPVLTFNAFPTDLHAAICNDIAQPAHGSQQPASFFSAEAQNTRGVGIPGVGQAFQAVEVLSSSR